MPSGGVVTNVSIATNEQWTDKQTGQKQERTEWHHIVFFGRLGGDYAPASQESQSQTSPQPMAAAVHNDFDDDIPF